MAAPPDKLRPPAAGSPAPRQRLPTVLLRHRTAQGVHYDWMLADPQTPGDPAARLWTARMAAPSNQWSDLGTWDVEVIGAHRRDYLTYEGPISGGRGDVARVDEGTFIALTWSADRIEIDLQLRDCVGRVELVRRAGAIWRATYRPA